MSGDMTEDVYMTRSEQQRVRKRSAKATSVLEPSTGGALMGTSSSSKMITMQDGKQRIKNASLIEQ